MSKKNKQTRQILSDPLTMLDTLQLEATTDVKQALATLHASYLSSLQLQKKLTKEIKKTSHAIGEAKKTRQPISKLQSAMRELSKRLNPVSTKLKQLEKDVLKSFSDMAASDTTKTDNDNNLEGSRYNQPLKQRYKLAKAETNSIVIKTVNTQLINNSQSGIAARWNHYALNHPAGTIHHRIEWSRLYKQTYGHKSYYYYACSSDGDIVGILPVLRLTSRLFGNLMVSMPFFQRGGAIADSIEIENKLLDAATKEANLLGVSSIEYRDDIYRDDMPVLSHKVNMILSLPETTEILWKNFTPKLRAQIKRPQRENPQKFVGRLEYLDDFYKVYTRNMRDLGSPPHSKLFIKTILQTFPDNSWLIVIRHNNQAVAAALLLASEETIEIPLASTIRDVNPLSMNMFLYWEVLKFAIEHQYRYFDFGRSSKDTGTFRFKQQWGAKPQQLFWHYWLPGNTELPQLNPGNPKYALAINAWKRLPIAITKWLGPYIVKNLP